MENGALLTGTVLDGGMLYYEEYTSDAIDGMHPGADRNRPGTINRIEDWYTVYRLRFRNCNIVPVGGEIQIQLYNDPVADFGAEPEQFRVWREMPDMEPGTHVYRNET